MRFRWQNSLILQGTVFAISQIKQGRQEGVRYGCIGGVPHSQRSCQAEFHDLTTMIKVSVAKFPYPPSAPFQGHRFLDIPLDELHCYIRIKTKSSGRNLDILIARDIGQAIGLIKISRVPGGKVSLPSKCSILKHHLL